MSSARVTSSSPPTSLRQQFVALLMDVTHLRVHCAALERGRLTWQMLELETTHRVSLVVDEQQSFVAIVAQYVHGSQVIHALSIQRLKHDHASQLSTLQAEFETALILPRRTFSGPRGNDRAASSSSSSSTDSSSNDRVARVIHSERLAAGREARSCDAQQTRSTGILQIDADDDRAEGGRNKKQRSPVPVPPIGHESPPSALAAPHATFDRREKSSQLQSSSAQKRSMTATADLSPRSYWPFRAVSEGETVAASPGAADALPSPSQPRKHATLRGTSSSAAGITKTASVPHNASSYLSAAAAAASPISATGGGMDESAQSRYYCSALMSSAIRGGGGLVPSADVTTSLIQQADVATNRTIAPMNRHSSAGVSPIGRRRAGGGGLGPAATQNETTAAIVTAKERSVKGRRAHSGNDDAACSDDDEDEEGDDGRVLEEASHRIHGGHDDEEPEDGNHERIEAILGHIDLSRWRTSDDPRGGAQQRQEPSPTAVTLHPQRAAEGPPTTPKSDGVVRPGQVGHDAATRSSHPAGAAVGGDEYRRLTARLQQQLAKIHGTRLLGVPAPPADDHWLTVAYKK